MFINSKSIFVHNQTVIFTIYYKIYSFYLSTALYIIIYLTNSASDFIIDVARELLLLQHWQSVRHKSGRIAV